MFLRSPEDLIIIYGDLKDSFFISDSDQREKKAEALQVTNVFRVSAQTIPEFLREDGEEKVSKPEVKRINVKIRGSQAVSPPDILKAR